MTARELLNIRFTASALGEAATQVFGPGTENHLSKVCSRLIRIAESHSAIGMEAPPEATEIAQRFIHIASTNPSRLPQEFSTGRMARKLAASLCHGSPAIVRSEHLGVALNVLRAHDRTSVLLGVLDALLNTWDDTARANRLRFFLKPLIQAYDGRLQPLRRARENSRFLLEASGADALGAEMAVNGRPFGDAIDLLALSARARTTPFCDQVAVAYARTALRTAHASDALHSLISFLEERERGDIHKRCLAPIILALADRPNEKVKDRVVSVAFHTIGDPAHAHKWAPWSEASHREADELQRAHTVLQHWIAQRFITVFFETVAMDSDRREFWLRYAPHVSRFRIYGDDRTRRRLNEDARLRPFLRERFCRGTTASWSSAMMMSIKDRTIIEFGDIGNACYVYDSSDPRTPSFEKCHPTEQLKRTSMPLLFRSTGLNTYAEHDEGRVLHHPEGWQIRFAKWFQHYLGV